jgi:hypothetical protein
VGAFAAPALLGVNEARAWRRESPKARAAPSPVVPYVSSSCPAIRRV